MKEPNAIKIACWVPEMVINTFQISLFNYFTEIVYGSNPYSPKLLKYLVFELSLLLPYIIFISLYILYIYIYIFVYIYIYIECFSHMYII